MDSPDPKVTMAIPVRKEPLDSLVGKGTRVNRACLALLHKWTPVSSTRGRKETRACQARLVCLVRRASPV